MLIGAFRVIINNLFYESFDTTFMKNEKNCQNINYFFYFFVKFFFKWIINQYPVIRYTLCSQKCITFIAYYKICMAELISGIVTDHKYFHKHN